ncbi:MAG: bifunctional diaminohydroxyphosphoribosylaminopyrimidine deaminase/5-amino-6-(5-phosphoribosylamino)uracil reductase RibD [Cyclobacteriaceae bacterium]|nr:bifunctional diaminohydroxyphosphoribosylaminopyrimidine deaminase/5-amino-6-(5-phosphoribosylamino)uracil reductase RibD [Cyclobacteriaceae bacterium]
MTPDEIFMLRAIALARLGIGNVSPNPRVGCVIVHDGVIIGEGWHERYGQAHAEVNAIESVADKSLLPSSTLYVNLEPCSHTGKTPPCADLLIKHRLKRVVVADEDPNPLVAGRGIKKLMEAGINVSVGVLEKKGAHLNRRFFTFFQERRPYIILKWAQTIDGFVAHSNFDSKWISNELSRQMVHKWRAEEDAILVGARTAAHDNPKLNVRDWMGRNPVRIVIDRNLSLDGGLHLFDGSQKTLCYNSVKDEKSNNLEFIRVSECTVPEIVDDLFKRNIQSIIVEGGANTLNDFITCNLWDEARVFVSSNSFNEGIKGPLLDLSKAESEAVESDQLLTLLNQDVQNFSTNEPPVPVK